MKKLEYCNLKGLENIFLEDSYVLDIKVEKDSITFYLEIVICPKHQSYHEPLPDEQYCYRKGELVFNNIKQIEWIKTDIFPKFNPSGETIGKIETFPEWLKNDAPFTKDLDGEIDYGNINALYFLDNNYHVFGDWGELKINSSSPEIKYKE